MFVRVENRVRHSSMARSETSTTCSLQHRSARNSVHRPAPGPISTAVPHSGTVPLQEPINQRSFPFGTRRPFLPALRPVVTVPPFPIIGNAEPMTARGNRPRLGDLLVFLQIDQTAIDHVEERTKPDNQTPNQLRIVELRTCADSKQPMEQPVRPEEDEILWASSSVDGSDLLDAMTCSSHEVRRWWEVTEAPEPLSHGSSRGRSE